jgi:hypothetical protein
MKWINRLPGGPYVPGTMGEYLGQNEILERHILNYSGWRMLCASNRWRFAAWTVTLLWILTLALAALGKLGAPLAYLSNPQ